MQINIETLSIGLILILFWKHFFRKKQKKEKKLLAQEKILEECLQSLEKTSDENHIIYLYEKFKEHLDYDSLVEIISKLIEIKAFPKGVTDWLIYPTDYSKEDLSDIMNELIALRRGEISNETAVNAYSDGFISSTEILKYIDKIKYPKTIAALLSDPDNYDEIKKIFRKEKKAYPDFNK